MLKIGKTINKIKEEKLKKIKNKKGFTLIELVIVIVIIGILVALAVSDLSRDTEDAKIARAKADLKTLSGAAQMFIADTSNKGTKTITDGESLDSVCTTLQSTDKKADGSNAGPWIKTCPDSPWTGADNKYKVSVEDLNGITEISFSVVAPSGDVYNSKDLSKKYNE